MSLTWKWLTKKIIVGEKINFFKFTALRVNMMRFISEKRNLSWTKNASHLVGKIGVSFRHLTIKWNSNHQTGVGTQPVY